MGFGEEFTSGDTEFGVRADLDGGLAVVSERRSWSRHIRYRRDVRVRLDPGSLFHLGGPNIAASVIARPYEPKLLKELWDRGMVKDESSRDDVGGT